MLSGEFRGMGYLADFASGDAARNVGQIDDFASASEPFVFDFAGTGDETREGAGDFPQSPASDGLPHSFGDANGRVGSGGPFVALIIDEDVRSNPVPF